MKYYLTLCCALLGISASISHAQELPGRELRQVFAANDFDQPLFLTHAGDGSDRIFVVEKPGRIKVMPNIDAAVATDFLDIRDQVNPVSEGGLLSVAFHPEHGTNGLFYVYYTRGNFFSRVSEFRVSDDPNVADVDSERVLWEVSQPATNHNGGQLAFGPDGMLYVGLGDGGGGGDTFRNGQDPTTWLAAILRIDVDARTAGLEYSIPPDNPFVGNSQDWREEIWAYGLRNPWRFSFDRKGGQLWAGDVGQNLWEEIDLIEKGANYGWKRMEGFHCFDPPEDCSSEGLTLPVAEYGHDVGHSITGGYVYRAARLGGLYGVYIYGDFITKKIWGLRYEEGEVRSNNLIATCPSSISSFGEDESGEVYIVGFEGPIYVFELLPVVDLVGDISRNGEVRAFDAGLALKHSVGVSDVIVEYFGGDEALFLAISDVTRNGEVTSFDAVRILQFVAEIIPGLPFVGNVGSAKVVADAAPRMVGISDGIQLSGNTVKIPVSIDDMTGVLGAGISISYDASKLKAVGVSPADILSPFMFQSNILDNEVKLAFASAYPVEGGGDIAYIEFEIIPSVSNGLEDDLLKVSDVQLNEGLIPAIIEQVELSLDVVPEAYALFQNYPNPFNPETVIHYDFPIRDHVEISIFNMMGQKVATLVDEEMDAGRHSVVWDSRDDNGESLASGIYLYRMETDVFVQTRKLILMR